MNTETNYKQFERLCKKTGIQTTSINFFATQEQIFKLFLATKEDCKQSKQIKPSKHSTSSNEIIKLLDMSTNGLTSSEIANSSKYSIRTIQQMCKQLERKRLITVGGYKKNACIWKIKE